MELIKENTLNRRRTALHNHRILKEDFGESEELDNFVYLIDEEFFKYYIVTLKVNKQTQERYFVNYEGAKKYYDTIIEEFEKDPDYYDGGYISIEEAQVIVERDELDYKFLDKEEEE